ncbi:YihY/virulence factor BrkB family protein [Jiangella anatolica]|uniref:YihY/virulence factor BrkB family protein n=1 Tax=Jiangella anatolica TaxID=2670374 RepID=A0A2W2BYA3_9ACTN|nr:YihY/virulence factor BrkB family protein [Jiangella anatolica]PZF85464.1 YihY/virulence factor BrkB family protein [Jiangella anatolica]
MIGRLRAVWERLQQTLPLRAWKRYGDLRGNRLAGASSFYGFVSLFPLLVLAAAIVSAIAGPSGVATVQEIVDDNLPGLQIDIASFHRNAGTLGVIGAGVLLFTGLGWVDSVRAAVRSMWGLDDQPGNIVVRKGLDIVALAGLGVLILVSSGASVLVISYAGDVLDWLGFGTGGWLLRLIGGLVSVGGSMALFAYMLSGLPRIVVPWRNLVVVSLLSAVVFEVLKQFLVQYVVGTASQNSYAAFAAPLALLAWIYLVTRLLMVAAALTAESAIDELEAGERAEAAGGMQSQTRGQGPAPAAVLSPGQVRATEVAAGAVLGAAGVALAVLAARAASTARGAFRRQRE